MNRKLRDDLVETGIEPKAAVVLASVIPDISAIDDLRAHMHKRFHRLEATLDRGFDHLERIRVAGVVLIIAVRLPTGS